MKNITCINNLQSCHICKLKGFFCYTPDGADFETCPGCGRNDFLNNSVNYKNIPTKYDFLFEDEFDNDMRNEYRYCEFCKIIFKLGCPHYFGGCTTNIYNCHFVKKWKDKNTNIEYQGMPQFDDNNDWFNNVNSIEVLQMCCPHNDNKCKKRGHPISGNCDIKNIPL